MGRSRSTMASDPELKGNEKEDPEAFSELGPENVFARSPFAANDLCRVAGLVCEGKQRWVRNT